MNRLFLIVALCLLIHSAQAGWFSDDTRQKLEQKEAQLVQQREKTGNWQMLAAFLGITCVVMLVAGAAIGSKARREVKNARTETTATKA